MSAFNDSNHASTDREKNKHHQLLSPATHRRQQPYNKEMINVCHKNSKIAWAWYHYDYVLLTKHPLTTWFCQRCRTSTTKRVKIVEPAVQNRSAADVDDNRDLNKVEYILKKHHSSRLISYLSDIVNDKQ